MCATPLYSVSVLIKSVGVRGLRGSGDALWFQYLRFETSQSSPEIWRSLSSDFPGLFNDHWLGSSLLIKCKPFPWRAHFKSTLRWNHSNAFAAGWNCQFQLHTIDIGGLSVSGLPLCLWINVSVWVIVPVWSVGLEVLFVSLCLPLWVPVKR